MPPELGQQVIFTNEELVPPFRPLRRLQCSVFVGRGSKIGTQNGTLVNGAKH